MPLKFTKNISLTPHWERFVQEKLDSGRYQSASEVVREALRLMEEKDRDTAVRSLRERIDIGWEQCEQGRTRDGETVFAEQRKRLEQLLKAPATGKSRRGKR